MEQGNFSSFIQDNFEAWSRIYYNEKKDGRIKTCDIVELKDDKNLTNATKYAVVSLSRDGNTRIQKVYEKGESIAGAIRRNTRKANLRFAGKRISSNIIRHAFVSYMYKREPDLMRRSDRRVELATAMGHDPVTFAKYRIFDLKDCRPLLRK